MMVRALVLALALGAATPGAAQDFVYFRSPTGNISCAIMVLDDFTGARCDLSDFEPSFATPPADCDLDWGYAFEVPLAGPGAPICAGDTVRVPDAPVLDYGEKIGAGGMTCLSERSGMTCRNPEGHGFTVARARQKVF